jgi:hypothetical protein
VGAGRLLRSECLTLRYRFEPTSVKLVVVTACPPKPHLYFYDPSGPVTESLFKTMMRALSYNPATKEDGLREFQRRGCLLLDATYRPVDGLSKEAHKKVVLQSYSALVAELTKMLPDKSTPILLVRARVREVLERRLRNDGFTLLTYSKFAAVQAAAE